MSNCFIFVFWTALYNLKETCLSCIEILQPVLSTVDDGSYCKTALRIRVTDKSCLPVFTLIGETLARETFAR